MGSYLRDTAFVLSAEPFKEQDMWLMLYGAQHGKMVGVARGVRSSRSKQRGHIEPFSKIEVMIAKGSAYDKVAVAQTCASSQEVRASLPGMAIFGSAVSLVARSTVQSAPNPRIFELLDQLQKLFSGSEVARISAERSALIFSSFMLHFLQSEGYAVEFDHCRLCGESLAKEAVWLSLEQGGVICRSCVSKVPQSSMTGDWISYPALQIVRFLLREPFTSILALSAPRSILQEVSFHIDRLITLLPQTSGRSAREFFFSLG